MPSSPQPAEPLRLDGAFARRTREDWRAVAEDSLPRGTTLESLARRTLDGLSLDVLHDASPVEGRWVPASGGAPGDADGADEPGTGEAGTRLGSRLRVLGDEPARANAHALEGLRGGADSLELSVAAGEGTPDALPLAALDAILDGVHLDLVTLSLRAGEDTEAAFEALLSLYAARGHDPARMRCELDGDPIGTLARRGVSADARAGDVAAGVEAAFGRLAAVAARAARELPRARVASVDMALHHEAGASVVQELVAGIASATLQLERLLDAGLDPAGICARTTFRTSCDANVVDGVVKLRALERLWRHVLVESGLPVVPPFVVAATSRRHLSRLAPWVNHLRNVAACTAAAIGDADVLMVHPHDLVDGRRVGDTAVVADRVARNLPLLLAEECGLADVADAAGGAHAIESLTQATVEAVWQGLGELQAEGGLVAALASGRWQAALARTHAARVARLRDGEAIRVGVNRFRPADAPPPPDTPAPADVPEGEGTRPGAPLRAVREAAAFESGSSAEAGA